jgi:hypothetical protein
MPKPASKVIEGANELSTFFRLLGEEGIDVDAFVARMKSGKQLKYRKRICALIKDGGVNSLSDAEIKLRRIVGTRASEDVFGSIEWSNHLGVIPPDKLPSFGHSDDIFYEDCPLSTESIRRQSFWFLGLPEFEEGKSVGLPEVSALLKKRGIHVAAYPEVMKTEVSAMQLAWYMTPAFYGSLIDFTKNLHEVSEAPEKYRTMTTVEYLMRIAMSESLVLNRGTAQWGANVYAKTTTGFGENLYVRCGPSTLYVHDEKEMLERANNHYFLPITRVSDSKI